MKISAIVASLVASKLLATDAKPEAVTAELSKLLATDKKAKDEAKEKDDADKAAADKAAKDAAEKEDPENTNDADLDDDMDAGDEFPEKPEGGAEKPGGKDKKAKDKKGMDSAGVAALIAANDAKHVAAREVESILGIVTHDSADAYYNAALTKLGVDTAGVHASAFPSLLKIAKDRAVAASPIVGDSAASADMVKNIPGLARLRK